MEIWDRIDRISDEELWRTHERRRERLVVYARERIRQEMKRNGVRELSFIWLKMPFPHTH
jgi:starch phosphorylase